MFAFIYDKNDLTPELLEKYKNGIIFCKTTNQMYNPLTNTWIGINSQKLKKCIDYLKQTQLCNVGDILWSDLEITNTIRPVSDGVVPIGICVANDNYLSANEPPRFWSLKFMDYTNPHNGSTYGAIYSDLNGIRDYTTDSNNCKVFFGTNDNQKPTDVKSYSKIALNVNNEVIYFDENSSINNGLDRILFLIDAKDQNLTAIGTSHLDVNHTTQYAITPKAKIVQIGYDDKLDFDALGLDDIDNSILADIDGKINTEATIDYICNQEGNSWKTANQFQYQDDYSAFKCTYKYHPNGSEIGDWYIPSLAEYYGLFVYMSKIKSVLTELNAIYPNDCSLSMINKIPFNLSSSTIANEYDSQTNQIANYRQLHLSLNYGTMYINDTNTFHNCVPMTQIPFMTSYKKNYIQKKKELEVDLTDYASKYLTLRFEENGIFGYNLDCGTLEINYNNTGWINVNNLYSGIHPTINHMFSMNVFTGDEIQLRAYYNAFGMKIPEDFIDDPDLSIYQEESTKMDMLFGETPYFDINCKFVALGNILSLYYGDNFKLHNEIPQIVDNGVTKYHVLGLFAYCNKLIDSKNIVFPYYLQPYCFAGMFNECTNMVKTISNITNLNANNNGLCYGSFYKMFNYCQQLEKAPNINNITQIAKWQCGNMFSNCDSLEEVPNLHIVSCDEYGCYEMFYSCDALTQITKMNTGTPTSIVGKYCYSRMFMNCISLSSIPHKILGASTVYEGSYSYMFYNTNLTTLVAGILPATTLGKECYAFMFSQCAHLLNLDSQLLPATILADSCYISMFQNCSILASIPNGFLPATTLAISCYKNMFRGCTELVFTNDNVYLLPATILAESCYEGMFSLEEYDANNKMTNIPQIFANVQQLAKNCCLEMFAYQAIETLYFKLLYFINGNNPIPLAYGCYKGMFKFNRKMAANALSTFYLPATTLAEYCYNEMFSNCLLLEIIPKFILQSQNTNVNNITAIPNYAFKNMFNISITNASSRIKSLNGLTFQNVITIGDHGCYGMFNGQGRSVFDHTNYSNLLNDFSFKNLQTIGQYGLYYMFAKQRQITEVPDGFFNSLTTVNYYGCAAIFLNCDYLIKIPTNLFAHVTTLNSNYQFKQCFRNCNKLSQGVTANLFGTTNNSKSIAYGALSELFYDCSSLDASTALNNGMLKRFTSNAARCYDRMFYGTATTTLNDDIVPINGTLQPYMCMHMFENCKSLTTVGKIFGNNDITLNGAYACHSMFKNCTALTTIDKDIIKKIQPNGSSLYLTNNSPRFGWAFESMFEGCISLIEGDLNMPLTNQLYIGCFTNMFKHCTALTKAPKLEAPTLVKQCYYSMFNGCTNLNKLTATFTSIVSSTTNADNSFTRVGKTTSTDYIYKIVNDVEIRYYHKRGGDPLLHDNYFVRIYPDNNDSYTSSSSQIDYLDYYICDDNDNYYKCETIFGNDSNGWLYETASSGTFYKNSSMTISNKSLYSIPNSWSIANAS